MTDRLTRFAYPNRSPEEITCDRLTIDRTIVDSPRFFDLLASLPVRYVHRDLTIRSLILQ